MFRTETVTENFQDLPQLIDLYKRAFPANERRSLIPLLKDRSEHSDFIAFYDGDTFCGFACLLIWKDIAHIIYFTIEDTLRNNGYGSKALQLMHKQRPNYRFIADLEAVVEDCPNYSQRLHRRQFYDKNGYQLTPVAYPWRGEDYIILAYNGTISNQEFSDFWKFFEEEAPTFSAY